MGGLQETSEEAPGYDHLPTQQYLSKFGPFENFGSANGHFYYVTKAGVEGYCFPNQDPTTKIRFIDRTAVERRTELGAADSMMDDQAKDQWVKMITNAFLPPSLRPTTGASVAHALAIQSGAPPAVAPSASSSPGCGALPAQVLGVGICERKTGSEMLGGGDRG